MLNILKGMLKKISASNTSGKRPVSEWMRSALQVKNPLVYCGISELFGTFMMQLLGSCFAAQFMLSSGEASSMMQVSMAWGFMVSLVIYCMLYTSGGQINPAISFTFWMMGYFDFKFIQFIVYSTAQTLGCFLANFVVYHLYKDEIDKFSGGIQAITGPKATASIFSNFPLNFVSNYTGFIDGAISTAVLLFFVSAMTNRRSKVPLYLFPFYIGLLIFVLISAFGLNVGCTINPGANISGRLFLWLVGYGEQVISWHNYYFWVPVVAPFVGGPVGAFLYQLFIGIHMPDDESDMKNPPIILEKVVVASTKPSIVSF